MPIALQIAAELGVRPPQVQTAIDLLDGGATVPFIARYRKEATGGLDDAQLRELQMRLGYLREHRSRAHQAGAGRFVSALQAQKAHQGADCA